MNTEAMELVMHVESVMQPPKVTALIGKIECEQIEAREEVIIVYDGQEIAAKVYCFEDFGKIYDEAVHGQEVVMAFYPTATLRSIKRSHELQEDKTYKHAKSTVVVYRAKKVKI